MSAGELRPLSDAAASPPVSLPALASLAVPGGTEACGRSDEGGRRVADPAGDASGPPGGANGVAAVAVESVPGSLWRAAAP